MRRRARRTAWAPDLLRDIPTARLSGDDFRRGEQRSNSDGKARGLRRTVRPALQKIADQQRSDLPALCIFDRCERAADVPLVDQRVQRPQGIKEPSASAHVTRPG